MEGEMRVWWVLRGPEKYGPYTRSELTAMAADGNVVGTDKLWKEGLQAPVPASSVKGLIPPVASPPPPPPPAQSRAAADTTGLPPTAAAGAGGGDPHNPYQPPHATLSQAGTGAALEFGQEAARLAAGTGSAWWGEAWELFKLSPLLWIAANLIIVACLLLTQLVPILGPLAQTLATPVFIGGMVAMAHHAHVSGTVEIDRLFDGFRQKLGPLLVLGLLNLGLTFLVFLVAGILIVVFVGGSVLHGLAGTHDPNVLAEQLLSGGAITGILVALLLIVGGLTLVMAAVWFAPPLIMLADMSPTAAIGASFSACVRNWLPMLVYSLLGLLFLIVAALPLLLGYLVLIPLILLTIYTSFSQIFSRQTA